MIHYLNFKADSITGLFFEDDDPRFEVLSPELLKITKVSLFVPPLKRVKFFGYSKVRARAHSGLLPCSPHLDAPVLGARAESLLCTTSTVRYTTRVH